MCASKAQESVARDFAVVLLCTVCVPVRLVSPLSDFTVVLLCIVCVQIRLQGPLSETFL